MLKILNEDYFKDIELSDDDIVSPVDNEFNDNNRDITDDTLFDNAFIIEQETSVKPTKFNKLKNANVNLKIWWQKLCDVMDNIRVFNSNYIDVFVLFKNDSGWDNRAVPKLNSQPVVLSDFRNLSAQTIIQKISDELQRVTEETGIDWQLPENDRKSVIMQTEIRAVGNWIEYINFERFCKDMSMLYHIMVPYNKYMQIFGNAYCNNTNETTYVFRKDGEVIDIHLPLGMWNMKTYKSIYNKLIDQYFNEDVKGKNEDIYKSETPLAKRWHQIYFLPDAQTDYVYLPIGLNSEMNQFYVGLARKDDSKWTYEQINEWFKTHFIDRLKYIDKLGSMGQRIVCEVELFICIGKDVPPRSDNKKRYVYQYVDKVNDCQEISYKFIYFNEHFTRIGQPVRGYISNSGMNMINALHDYEHELKIGKFGKDEINKLPDIREELKKL